MISRLFTSTIYVQAATTSFGGATTWADVTGSNKGYIRTLSDRERGGEEQSKLFSTHRAVMTMTIVPTYGQRLRFVEDGTTKYYMVKGVNLHKLSGGTFQIVDCEAVI